MSYRPKSTYQVLQTSGKEFQTRRGQLYSGPYILTSEGAFMGNDITNMGQKLVKAKSPSPSKISNILETPQINEYYRLKPNVVKFIKNTQPLVSTKTFPTKKDYDRGWYVRYFAKKFNSLVEYYEIDNKTYKLINAKNPQYDYNSFGAGKLIWALEGDVVKANSSILSQNEIYNPNISYLFPNLSEFVKPKAKKEKPNLSKVTTKVQLRGEYHSAYRYIPPIEVKSKLKELKDNHPQRQAAPPGHHYMPNGSLMLNSQMPSTGGGTSGNGGSSGGGGGGY